MSCGIALITLPYTWLTGGDLTLFGGLSGCADISLLSVSLPLCLFVYVSVFVPLSDDSWRRAAVRCHSQWEGSMTGAPVLPLDTRRRRQGILPYGGHNSWPRCWWLQADAWMMLVGREWIQLSSAEPQTRYFFIHLCSSSPAVSCSRMLKNRSTAGKNVGLYLYI